MFRPRNYNTVNSRRLKSHKNLNKINKDRSIKCFSSDLLREVEEIKKKESETRKKAEETECLLAKLPQEIENRKRKERAMIRIRAQTSATLSDGFSRSRTNKRSEFSQRFRYSKNHSEDKAAKMQFFILCVVLIFITFLLIQSIASK